MKANNWFIGIAPNIDEFKKEIWGKISGDKKVVYAWGMVVEAMTVRREKKRLKLKKILTLPKKKLKTTSSKHIQKRLYTKS